MCNVFTLRNKNPVLDFPMKKIGYARVSTPHQNLDRQLESLRNEGCKRIFTEKVSGKNTHQRPKLTEAIESLDVDDMLVLAEWDRATRSMFDGIKIMDQVHQKRATLKVLDRPYLDLSTPIGKGFLAFLSGMAEDERQRIARRAGEGRTVAKRKGKHLGRKAKLTQHQKEEVRKRKKKGESYRALAMSYGVSVATIYRALAQ